MGAKGDILAAIEGATALLVSCVTFRTETGTESAEAAEAFVYWPGEKPWTEVPGPKRAVERVWPDFFAWVRFGEGTGLSVPGCIPNTPLEIWIQKSTAEGASPREEARTFLKVVGLLMREMGQNSYGEGMLALNRITLNELGKNDDAEGREYMEARLGLEAGAA